MGIEENKSTVRRFMKAFEDGDLDTVVSLIDTKNFKIWSAGPMWFSGWHNFEEMLELTRTGTLVQFPEGIKFIMGKMTAEDNRVAAEIESDGKHWSGKTYHNFYHFLWEFNDQGKIVVFKEYLDTAMCGNLMGFDKPNLPPKT